MIDVRVQAIRFEADAVRSFELHSLDGSELPSFTAGSHIDVLLPDGAERSYSLLNGPQETHRYVIAVKRDAEGRGASIFMCDTLRVGETLRIKSPRNSFPLQEAARHSVLIAGGIGITPILSMVRRLEALQRSWRLFYAARSRAAAPFLEVLAALEAEAAGRITVRFSNEPDTSGSTVADILRSSPPDTHFYCCGPLRMLKSFEAAAATLPPGQSHMEYFASDGAVAPGGFDVVLARSSRTLRIPPDRTILETLLANGMDLPRSCMEGVCGTCETVVLEGTPDHRDHVLTARERRLNRKMMICRSGCIGDRLVLDL